MHLAYLYAAAAGPLAPRPAEAGGFDDPHPAAISATLARVRALVVFMVAPLGD
jgi:hypothetical protein